MLKYFRCFDHLWLLLILQFNVYIFNNTEAYEVCRNKIDNCIVCFFCRNIAAPCMDLVVLVPGWFSTTRSGSSASSFPYSFSSNCFTFFRPSGIGYPCKCLACFACMCLLWLWCHSCISVFSVLADIRSFQKNATFLLSFMFFTKECGVLCVLLHSL